MNETWIDAMIRQALEAQMDLDEIADYIRDLPDNQRGVAYINERIQAARMAFLNAEAAIWAASRALEDLVTEVDALEIVVSLLFG